MSRVFTSSLQRLSSRFLQSQKKILAIENEQEPVGKKTDLRVFAANELAALWGIKDYEIRNATRKDGWPEAVKTSYNANGYRIDDIPVMLELLGRSPAASVQPFYLCVSNFKGGSGKTTLSIHLAQFAALMGYRVLLVDLDPQASATSSYGLIPGEDYAQDETLYEAISARLRNEPAGPVTLQDTNWGNRIKLAAGCYDMQFLEFEVAAALNRDPSLRFWELVKDELDKVSEGFDLVVFDTPPTLGFITLNAVSVAHGIVIPTPPSMLDFVSTGSFMKMLATSLKMYLKAVPVGNGGSDTPLPSAEFVRFVTTKLDMRQAAPARISQYLAHIVGIEQMCPVPLVTSARFEDAMNRVRTIYESRRETSEGYTRIRDAFDGIGRDIMREVEQVRTRWLEEKKEADHAA